MLKLMSDRIKNIFKNKSKKLVTFVTGGDPDYESSMNIIKKISENGADIIEIGMPFSDPMADGPIIQLSSLRAIKQEINLNKIFLMCKEFRKFNNNIPIILMGYYNPILHYGNENFISKCSESGVDGLIIVDLQPENDNELLSLAKKNNIEFIRLITPTTDESRLNIILSNASGFIYYVSVTGITGQKSADLTLLKKSIMKIKEKSKLPVLVGFGIKSPEQAKDIVKFADGVIVGSSIVKIIQSHIVDKVSINNATEKIIKFVKLLKEAII